MMGTLTTEPLGHLVAAADQAHLIVTDMLIYCTVYEYSNIREPLPLHRNKFLPEK